MNNLLMVSYNFPPIQSVEGFLVLKLAKYLPKFGWSGHVLCAKRSSTKAMDRSHLQEINDSIAIDRTNSLEHRAVTKLSGYTGLDDKLGWLPFAVSRGKKILENTDIKAIYSSSMPITSHLVAYHLKKKYKLPWLAHFSDPWTLNPYHNYRYGFIKRIDKKMESAEISLSIFLIIKYREK